MDFTKPRIAIYYDILPQTGWRNDGAPLAVHYNLHKILNGKIMAEIQKEGMPDTGNVVHLSPINPTAQHGKFDLNLLVDYGEDNLGIPLDWNLPRPNAYWAFDTHIDEKGFQYRLSRAKAFDTVFLCHESQIRPFIEGGIAEDRIHYLPVAAEVDCYRPYPVMAKWNWSFIGHLNSTHRIELVDRFVKEFGLGDQAGYLGWRRPELLGYNVLDDAAKKFSMSRLTLHYSIRQDLAMRVFEAMATNTLLLADDIPPIHEFFEDRTHLVLFKSIDEAIALAREFLANVKDRQRIARAGYQEILAHHTYHDRTLDILKKCLDYTPQEIKGRVAIC